MVDEAPTGSDWLHEIKYDGYRMPARIDGGQVKLLPCTGLGWSHRYRRTIDALRSLKPSRHGRRPHGSPVSLARPAAAC
jgi:ATP-dependent DNA ligase